MAVYEKWKTIKYGAFTVGKDASGYDVTFFGATTANYVMWDASANSLLLYGTFAPGTTDKAALGTSALMFSDLFLASGAVINFNAGNVTITHAAGALACTGALTLSIATATTSATTGALIVTGGIGTSAALWVGTTSRLVGNVQMDGTLIVGNDAAGRDFTVYGDVTAYKSWWDANADTNGTWYFGADTKGVDVKAYGATTGNYLHWDASADDLLLVGTATQLAVAGTATSTTTTTGSLRTAGGLGVVENANIGGSVTVTGAVLPAVSGTPALGSATLMWSDLFLKSGAVINFNNGAITITHSTGVLTIAGARVVVSSTGDYISPAFSVTRTFVTSDFDQTYHAAARVNLDLTNDVPDTKYASAFNIRIIGAGDVASGGQLYGLWVDSAGTAAAIGGTFHMARFSVQAGAAIPTSYMQFQTADPGVAYAFAFVNNAAIPPCTAGGSDCTASGATDPTYTIAVQTPDGNPGYIRVWAAK